MSAGTTPTRVLVTGGHGLLGRALMRELADRDDVTALAPPRTELDLLDYDHLRGFLTDHSISTVIHLAADCGGIGYNLAHPASLMVTNTQMSLNIYRAAHACGATRVISAGSCDAYPATAPVPWREESLWEGLPEATSASYGLAKRYHLAIGEAFHRQYGLNSTHLILANLFGEDDTFDTERGHLIPATIVKIDTAIRDGCETVQVWGDGTPRRELLYAPDAARIFTHILVKHAGPADGVRCWNVGSGIIRSVRDVVESLAAQMGYEGRFDYEPARAGGHPVKSLDATALRTHLGPAFTITPFEEAVAATVAGYQAQHKRSSRVHR